MVCEERLCFTVTMRSDHLRVDIYNHMVPIRHADPVEASLTTFSSLLSLLVNLNNVNFFQGSPGYLLSA
jgi:hypothetical protein